MRNKWLSLVIAGLILLLIMPLAGCVSPAPHGFDWSVMIFFILLLEPIFHFDPTPYWIVIFILHAVSMHVPFKMPFLIRSLTKSPVAIGMVNVALLLAWLLPFAAPIVAASFFVDTVAECNNRRHGRRLHKAETTAPLAWRATKEPPRPATPVDIFATDHAVGTHYRGPHDLKPRHNESGSRNTEQAPHGA